MKRTAILLIIVSVFFGSFSVTGCYYDVEEELYGNACDTANVTYSATITGLLNSYGCVSCHSGATPSGSFRLQTHAEVKAKITDGRLLGAINHTPGFAPMPQGANKMNRCDIEKIEAWANAGAPNN
jgi:hypothetical protein